MSLILRAENISRTLSGEVPVTLVDQASLEVHQGELVVITGPSGSGKSSLLYLLGLLDRPSSGRLWLQGVEVANSSDDECADIRLSELGFVFQFHFLLPEFSVQENVMLPMRRLARFTIAEMRERAESLLESFELLDQAHKLPKQISGGQAQRVAIARALANDPLLILADEPTGNLDTASSINVQKILKGLAHQRNRAVVAVTHDMDFAAMADRRIRIVDGRIVSETS